MKARSPNRSPKCALKLEALVELGILDFDATVDCKCQEQNSISKELSRGASLIEYSRRIFGLSWFQLTGLLEKFVDYIMVENRTQQPETASELLPDLKKGAFSLNFWVELSLIPIFHTTIIGNR